MDGFQLSPGITPLLTDLAVAALPLALAGGLVLGRDRGLLMALGLVTLVLGLVKVATDWSDLWDLVVALGAVIIGTSAIARPVLPSRPPRIVARLAAVGGGIGLFLGAYKALSDFYDPFDLELALMTFAVAAILLWSLRSGWGTRAEDRPTGA